jgi:hypothetical protein
MSVWILVTLSIKSFEQSSNGRGRRRRMSIGFSLSQQSIVFCKSCNSRMKG